MVLMQVHSRYSWGEKAGVEGDSKLVSSSRFWPSGRAWVKLKLTNLLSLYYQLASFCSSPLPMPVSVSGWIYS